jgi:hypothetical protein
MAGILDPAGDPLLDPDGDPLTIGPPDVPTLEAGHLVVHGGEIAAPGVVPSLEAGHIVVHGGTLTAPPDPELWGTPGGARSPYWGDSVKLFVQLALEQGATWTLGPHPFSRFDAGNCLDRATNIGPDPSGVTTTRVWTDVSCEVLDLDIASGATASDGVFARAEASTAVIVLADPQRRYDPLNPDSPFMRSTRSRLLAGTPVFIWAETLQPPATVGRHVLFSGRVESWREPQTPHVQNRRATLTCVDGITELAHRRRSVFDTVGAGEPVHERLARILEVFDGPRLIGYDPLDPEIVSEVHLQETELAGTAWELIGKAVDAEIGFAYLAPYNAVDPLDVFTEQGIMGLRFLPRSAWSDPDAPVVEVPCAMVIDATADSLGRQLRNVVIGARSSSSGEITARSGSSIDRYGEIGYRNTDLGLVDNDEVNVWVNYVLAMFAFPRPALSDLILRPKAVPYSWWWVLRESVYFASSRMLIEWTPPGTTTVYAVSARVTGAHHAISRQGWEVRWQLGAAEMMGRIWTLGPDPHDRFDDRNTLSFAPA